MIITIPIEIIELEDQSYHVMISAIFNKQTPGNLIIDTGASKTVFDQQFVEPFAVDTEKVDDNNSSGINAMIMDTHSATIPHLAFNELKIENYQCVLLDLSHINQLYEKYSQKQIAGLIGSDFLVEYNAVINYGKKELTLIKE